ncbi:myb domain containing protein [Gracilaria domingensis]|nr:myb domain containing protein [Gracilaria domingensis]
MAGIPPPHVAPHSAAPVIGAAPPPLQPAPYGGGGLPPVAAAAAAVPSHALHAGYLPPPPALGAFSTAGAADAGAALPALHPVQHVGYYDTCAKVSRLEQQLQAAHSEIERLRCRVAELEKERGKSDAPKVQSRYWTPAEHQRFLEALQKFGPKDVRAIANYVGSRNATQVRTHAQKYFLRVAKKNGSLLKSRKRSMSESDLTKVGGGAANGAAGGVNAPPTVAMRTPPGSPSERQQAVTHTTSGVNGFTSVSAAKPPMLSKAIADSSGINLLSLVASERKMEEMRQ